MTKVGDTIILRARLTKSDIQNELNLKDLLTSKTAAGIAVAFSAKFAGKIVKILKKSGLVGIAAGIYADMFSDECDKLEGYLEKIKNNKAKAIIVKQKSICRNYGTSTGYVWEPYGDPTFTYEK